jgi:hypothetical protein
MSTLSADTPAQLRRLANLLLGPARAAGVHGPPPGEHAGMLPAHERFRRQAR